MPSRSLRAAAVRQALASPLADSAPVCLQEMHLLTQYILGHLSAQQTNELLRAQGRVLQLLVPVR